MLTVKHEDPYFMSHKLKVWSERLNNSIISGTDHQNRVPDRGYSLSIKGRCSDVLSNLPSLIRVNLGVAYGSWRMIGPWCWLAPRLAVIRVMRGISFIWGLRLRVHAQPPFSPLWGINSDFPNLMAWKIHQKLSHQFYTIFYCALFCFILRLGYSLICRKNSKYSVYPHMSQW